MPHGESWFSLFPFHQRVIHWAAGLPLNEEGHTWIAHANPGVQHLYASGMVLLIIAIVGVLTDTSIRDAKNILPEGKFTVRTFAELLTTATYGMMADQMGAKAARFFLPLIGTCMFFILFSNMLGLVPGFLPATDNFNTTLACGIVVFIATHIYGLKENGAGHVMHLFGPWMGPWLIPINILMFFIEIISHLVRPLSLGIRLMANMVADHMVLGIFLGFAASLAFPVFMFIPLPLPLYLLGLLVVCVQALVFSLLSTVYIAMAIEHTEH